jgi:hypothetical protein
MMVGYLKTPAGTFHPPFRIVKMCVQINGEYNIFGVISHRFTTVMFQWPEEPNINQWSEGRVIPDDDNAKWIQEGSELTGAWSVTRKLLDDDRKLLPGVLECTSRGK